MYWNNCFEDEDFEDEVLMGFGFEEGFDWSCRENFIFSTHSLMLVKYL